MVSHLSFLKHTLKIHKMLSIASCAHKILDKKLKVSPTDPDFFWNPLSCIKLFNKAPQHYNITSSLPLPSTTAGRLNHIFKDCNTTNWQWRHDLILKILQREKLQPQLSEATVMFQRPTLTVRQQLCIWSHFPLKPFTRLIKHSNHSWNIVNVSVSTCI